MANNLVLFDPNPTFSSNEALRIAYIDDVEIVKNGKPSTEYYSKLVKADIHGKDKVSLLHQIFFHLIFL